MDKIFIEILEELTKLNASGKYTTFFEFAGHTRSIDIRIYKGKWNRNKKPISYVSMIYYESLNSGKMRRRFDPQTFLNYLAYLRKHRSTKQCPVLTYSDYGNE